MNLERYDLAGSAESFWSRVGRSDECWPWSGARHERGYGRVSIAGCPTQPAHHIAYVLTNGPIPEGMEIDHLCSNPPCCNPAHLEAVTHAENVYRSRLRRGFTASIHERPRRTGGSSWQVRWRVCEDGVYRSVTRTFHTREEAEAFVDQRRGGLYETAA